jgi:hypothetical protein
MPATSTSGYTLTNIGPLTTTFTAPASCATAYQIRIAPVDDPANFLGLAADCNYLAPDDCHPYGSVLNSIVSSARVANPISANILEYQSPGLVCPSGWATVGAATKLSPTSTSISGALNVSGEVPNNVSEFFPPYLDVFLDALDPSETAIACCPRLSPTLASKAYLHQ